MEFVGRRELSIYQVFGPALFSRTGSTGRQASAKDFNNLMAGYFGLFQQFSDTMKVDRIIETDVLIVGGGAAALRAAIGAGEQGVKVTVALKGKTGKFGASVSRDSPAVALQCADGCSADTGDSPEVHFEEIVSVGLGMADPRLALIQAYEIVERTRELESWGVEFVKDPTGRKEHFTAHSCFS